MADELPDTITFAEKVLLLLDQGAFSATYKFAVLLAIIDLCLEKSAADGRAPDVLTARDIADKTIELYWRQAEVFAGAEGPVLLRQFGGGQAEVISRIRDFRTSRGDPPTSHQARLRDPHGYERLLDDIEWKLIEDPLPRLQKFGGTTDRFLYDLDWDEFVRRRDVRGGGINTSIRLRPGVGEMLVRLSGLLRPLIQRQWAERVARFNRADVVEYELEDFLFGAPRLTPARLVNGLREIQDDACFYCAERLGRVEVDHFIPWARHPDDGVHNLVIAHPRCNRAKRDFLAATDHVERWVTRLGQHGADLDQLANEERWASRLERTHSVARSIYLRLREDARLWLVDRSFVTPDLPRLRDVLAGAPIAEESALAAEDALPYEVDPEGH
jgi:hypothetical protein